MAACSFDRFKGTGSYQLSLKAGRPADKIGERLRAGKLRLMPPLP